MRSIPMRFSTLLVVLAVAAGPAAAQTEAERLHAIFDDHQAWLLDEYPEMAMARGDYSDADRITDESIRAIERRHDETREFLLRLRGVDRDALKADDRLNYDLFELRLTNALEGHKFRMFLAPIGGRFGPQQEIPQMAERVRFATDEDYENYLVRLELVPWRVSQEIEKMRMGLDEGITPPRVTLEGLPDQLQSVLDGGLDALAAPMERMPASIPQRQRRAFAERFERTSMPAVRGAMGELAEFVTTTYLPGCRGTIACSALPDGEALYAYQLAVMTTTEMTAAEIHRLGLDEVARLRGEMMRVIRSSDFMERFSPAAALDDDELFAAFLDYLRTDPRFYYTKPDALLAGYRDICKRVDAWLPKLFETLPRLPYGVRAIPEFMAPTQTTAYYQRGDIRNAEPGWFYANTYALDQRPTYEMIPLALHEAVPGHHLQIALAQELEGLPEFRKEWGFTAFGEGWALYAERLGIEMGLYEDPYNDFGRLLYEMWRACRLVVDTGMHAQGWTRDQAIEFMVANTALSRLNISNEVDRYISWPGQACAYKIGELTIRELRQLAEMRLGADFDERAFHDVVLGAGSIPLTFLEDRVEFWINKQVIRTFD